MKITVARTLAILMLVYLLACGILFGAFAFYAFLAEERPALILFVGGSLLSSAAFVGYRRRLNRISTRLTYPQALIGYGVGMLLCLGFAVGGYCFLLRHHPGPDPLACLLPLSLGFVIIGLGIKLQKARFPDFETENPAPPIRWEKAKPLQEYP